MDTVTSVKRLPLGMNTFKQIIEENYVYSDKTKFVYDMASAGKSYFLSRPRRFGKSLLLSAFEALFSGPPDPDGPPHGLFKDLWIGRNSDYDFTMTYPIITISMAAGTKSPDELTLFLATALSDINDKEKLNLTLTIPNIDLRRIIEKLSEKYGKGVVVLIDEYDAPVSDNINNTELALKNGEILKDFYSGFKDTDKFLRFVLVTGITRYAFMGLSAGLNHLVDLTLNDNYSGIRGFTLSEFDECFSEHLPILLRNMKQNSTVSNETTLSDLRDIILKYYDGYSWDGKTMILNPISILNMFNESFFSRYWIQTNPSIYFLSKIAMENPLSLLGEESEKISTRTLSQAEVGSLGPIPSLFQTGYLTIDQVTHDADRFRVFTLKIPNLEVKDNNLFIFQRYLFNFLGREPAIEKNLFHDAIRNRDDGKLSRIINSVFASLPAERHDDRESCYHKILYGYCHKFGRIVTPERKGAIGDSDPLVIFSDGLYAAIELKFDIGQSIPGQERLVARLAKMALSSIDAKDYWRPYQAEAKELVKIGLGVSWRGQCLALIGNEEKN
ncbi:MAG: AAA family ATPase [Deltaproteobacteria bacterium]|jgi:hypothetical protein|nr:AAA family ATPase [Deltaproteobacteria bacterium]